MSQVTEGFMDEGSLGPHAALAGVDTRMPDGGTYHAKWDPSRSSFHRLPMAVAPQVLNLNSTVLNGQVIEK